MVAPYVDGARVGTLADAERLIPDLLRQAKTVELRAEPGGARVGTVTPEPLCPWDPTFTYEDATRAIKEPGGMSLAELRKYMGIT